MWETGCGGGNSSGANANGSGYNNRGLVLLLTVLLACVLLYKAWGPLLLITFALVLVVHTCYSLLVNDSLLAPYTLVLLGYAKELGLEAIVTARFLSGQGLLNSKKYYHYLRLRYTQWCARWNSEQQSTAASTEDNMNGRHRNVYRLSTVNDLADQGSPLKNDPYQSFALNGACNVARTSTPLPREIIWRKGTQPNGDLGQITPISNPQNRKANKQSENKQPSLTLSHNETVYSPKGSPWGKSISPKMKSKDSGVKTVQTVAGPLLTSSRFNVDPKIYSDINSPGLSSRLTKYASEANSKLTHQHQYGAGQFPKVNLNASPTPLLSPKVVRSRMPVTVRVAPPEITTYCPPDVQNQEKFKNTSPSEIKELGSAPSVAKVLKKISLKRHASREDIMLELVKKQRSERALHEDQLENLEEMMQKRAREESITSEEDLSPQSKNERPLKRPKAASSCHDILNSLSSSLHVLSGVKRKAMDTSRSSTPDVEKHFKPSSRSPTRTMSLNIFPSREPATSKEQLNVKIPIASASGEPYQEKQVKIPENKKPIQISPEKAQSETPKAASVKISKIHKEISATSKTEKLTDKLFMRAEPQSKEKLKDLINDSTGEATFITDDKDEIKKQDIVNMRQNSIRLRLQSMANAISGKSTNKIDPDVVIHAEEVNPPASSSSSSSPFATLSSLTTTTTVNTSPITTTIVPILKTESEFKSPTTKHVTFNLPSSTLSFSSTTNSSVPSLSALTSNELAKPVESKPVETSNFGAFGSTTTSAAPSYNFGSAFTTAVSTSAVNNTTSSGFAVSSNIATNSNTTSGAAITLNSTISSSPSLFAPKSTADSVQVTSTTSTGFSFGSAAKINTTTTAPTSSTSTVSFEMPKTTSFAIQQPNSTSNTMTSTFGSSLMKSPASVSLASTTASSAIPSFGGDKKTGGFSFGAPSSSNTTSTTASIFGSSSNTPMFSAGSNASTTTVASTPAVTTAPPSFSFGSGGDKPASTFSFGGSAAATTTTPASTQSSSLTFGTGGQTLRTSSAVPTFGATAPVNSGINSTVSASNSTFGSSAPSVFGTSTNSQSLFSGTSNTSTMFKSSTTTAASTTTATIFGSGTSGFGTSSAPTSASSTPSMFGNSPSVTTTSSKIPSLFGNTAAAGTATNAPSTASPFGGSATQQQGSIFSGTSAPTTMSSSIFGSPPSSTGLFNSNSGTTGQATASMAPAANATDGGSVFGQAKSTPNLSFGTTSSTFGSPNPASSFSAPNSNNTTSAFQLGSSTSTSGTLPAFGTIKPSTQFGATPLSQANTGSSIFGSTTGSGFGATSNPAPPAFGSTGTSNAFGMQSNTSATTSAFGTAAPTFGSSTGTSSPFGATSTNSTPSLFGNATSGAATNAPTGGSASFSFGGSQPTQQQPQQTQQPSASFSFGGTSNTNTGGGIFQFGASNTPKPGGFNFGAPTAAPTINFTGGAAPAFNAGAPGAAPAFNAPAANMFSIGSGGSSTPRPRASRSRRGR